MKLSLKLSIPVRILFVLILSFISFALLSLFNSASVSALSVTINPSSGNLSFNLIPGVFNKVSQTITVENHNYSSGYTMTLETYGYEYTISSSGPLVMGRIPSNDLINTTNPEDTTKRIPTLSSTITSPNDFNNNWGYSFFNTNVAADDPLRNTFYPIPGYTGAHPTPIQNTLVSTTTSSSTPDTYELSFGAKVDTSIPAGTYQNTVVVRIVSNPTTCSGNSICYDDNGANSPTGMSNQIISSTDTEVTLWPSNYQRPGYGFAGWNTRADGTGTSYGPNQTITDTTTIDNIKNNGLVLYAMWVQSAGNLQSWTPSSCNAMNIGDTTALTDNRDGNTYAIAKLADGKCWMIENMRLSDTHTTTGQAVTIDSTNTNNPAARFILNAPQDPTQTAWCRTDSASCYNRSLHAANNTKDTISNMTNQTSNIYSYGNYYNWYTATAGNGTYYTTSGVTTVGDICPVGWHLPIGGISANGGEFAALDIAIGGTGSTQDTAEAPNRWRSFPVNFVYSGVVYMRISDRGSAGGYWSSSAYSSKGAYALGFSSSYVHPGTGNSYSYLGRTLRCVLSTTYTINFDSNGGTGTMSPQTATVGQATNLSTNTFTRSGYTFTGWNTATDGSGTSYTDGQSVTNLASAGSSITLYAQWGMTLEQSYADAGKTKLNGYYQLQDMTTAICDAASIVDEASQMQAIDTRDNKFYWITKLKDGKCWFTQNLDHDIDSNFSYTPANTDIPANWTPDKATYQTGDTTWATDAGRYIQQSYDPGNKIWDGIPKSGSDITLDNMVQGTNTHYHIGNYYNFGAAVAMNDTSAYTTLYQDLNQSICPAGWTLPKAGNNTAKGSFRYLLDQYNYNASNAKMTNPYIWEAPLYFSLGGGWIGGSEGVAYLSNFWSSIVDDSGYSYRMLIMSDALVMVNGNSRFIGNSVRCVSR